MNLFKTEYEKEKKVIGFKSLTKSLKRREDQIGRSNKKRDVARKSLPPGKRRSKTGKVYYEARKNRSDKYGETI